MKKNLQPNSWNNGEQRPILSPYDLKLPQEQQALLAQIASILSTAALRIARKELRKQRPPKFDANA